MLKLKYMLAHLFLCLQSSMLSEHNSVNHLDEFNIQELNSH